MPQLKRKFEHAAEDSGNVQYERGLDKQLISGGEYEGRIPEVEGDGKISVSTCEDSDDDDDADLPIVNLTPSGDEDLTVGGLVWVKWKKIPFWPALVLKLYYTPQVKVKRVKVAIIEYQTDCLLDEAKCINRPFIIGYRRACIYPLSKDFRKHVSEGLQSKLKQEFCIAWRRVESYLFWSDTRPRPCVWKFFGIDDVTHGASSSDLDSLREKADDGRQTSTHSLTDEHTVDDDLYLDDSTAGPNHLNDRLISDSDEQLSPSQPQQPDPRCKEQYERSQLLINYMNSINGRKRIMLRLCGIERGQIKSAFKVKFDRKDKSRSDRFILRSQGFGPICNFDQVYEVFQICRKFSSELNKRLKKDTKLTYQSYLMEVIMPEVIVSSITSVEKVNRLMAEKAFYEGPQLDCDEY